ncbi:MAG: T9SS type A sorting domain-containing protein [Bacteroidia bacterium]|nr:T9SS type A sorting domain-containing protein [Bacteroidia bacterium]
MRLLLLACALAAATLAGNAQDKPKQCGTDEHLAEQLNLNAELRFAKNRFETDFKTFMKSYKPEAYKSKSDLGKASAPKYIIPVVVHVFHINGGENISDAQVQSEITFLNKSFRNLNSDTINRRTGWLHTSPTDSVWFDFKSLAADMEIEFRLARKDPKGNCTNGIVRLYTPLSLKGNDDIKKLSVWDSKRYFNMWVCKQINKGNTIGIAGYAQFPFFTQGGTGTSATDGVIIIHDEFGNIGTSQAGQTPNVTTVTHEAGHWLGLFHPFQIKTDSCGIDGDEIFDTPPTYFNPTSAEPLRIHCNNILYNTCSSEKPDRPDLQEAYMDYFIGSCASNLFTHEQKARAHFVLQNFRQQLWSTENLTFTGVDGSSSATCAPVAAFNSPAPVTCAGNKITFYDYSYNSAVTSWEWTFPGGSPSTITGKGPALIQYNDAGTYDVILKVTGPNGTDTKTFKNYVTIQPATPNNPKGYYTADWWYQNNWQESGWVFQYENPKSQFIRVGTSYNHNASMKLLQDPFNQKNSIGSLVSLISPSFNLEGSSNPYFAFNYALAQAILPSSIGGGNTAEELKTYTSTDCGKTWVLRDSKSGSNISTIGTGTSGVLNSSIDFTPSDQSKWKEVLINGAKVPLNSNVKFKIEFKYSGGNNFYLDNVRVGLATGINEFKLASQIKLNVSPNPFNTNTNISYQLDQAENVEIKLFDLLGKEVAVLFEGVQNTGLQSQLIEKNRLNLNAGVYIVQMQVGNSMLSHKIIVE